MPTSAAENYLRQIYELCEDEGAERVHMGQLAETMGVVPGTATAMVKRLDAEGLVDYEPYAGVRLSATGLRSAVALIRRHRLIEIFLVDMLGLDWSEIHEEARRLEHAVSERVLLRIEALLGHPTVDPHGDPIPDADGNIRPSPAATLWEPAVGERVRIVRVLDQDAEFLRYLARNGLQPGAVVWIDERDPAGEVMSVREAERRAVIISSGVAGKLLVEPVAAR